MSAFIVAKLAVSRNFQLARIIGFFFLIEGTITVMMLPSPAWFSRLDIITAYIPMAWLGAKIAGVSR
jgi:hypothetical protein